jgi:dipeptidyl-peptidase-4
LSTGRDSYLLDQWYADAGFVVVRVDGRGTPDRGRYFERAISGDLITLPLADQGAALQTLFARDPTLASQRVGVFGWSFGGYVAGMALLLRPDQPRRKPRPATTPPACSSTPASCGARSF